MFIAWRSSRYSEAVGGNRFPALAKVLLAGFAPNRSEIFGGVFVTESWGDHLRQHERVTAENREVEQRAQAFHLGPESPKITHLIAEEMPK
jgi:hypothetical protein